ncbi:MAG: BamA/TamA family outer membrane protein [Bacteroidota bacterium]
MKHLLQPTNIILAALISLLCSCTGLHKIAEGEKLYTGAEVKLHITGHLKNKKEIHNTVEPALRPVPNKKFLWMRPKLWFYQQAGTPEKKGFRSWLKKMGEPPVYQSQVKMESAAKNIDAALFNIGIFRSITEPEVKEKKKTASIIYNSYVHPPFTINTVKLPGDDDLMSEIIISENKNTLLKKGDNYSLNVLKAERERIDAALKNNGYFYFNPDYLLFKADTSETDRTVNLELSVKEETPYKSLLIYRLGNIYVNPGTSTLFTSDSVQMPADTLLVDSVYFIDSRLSIKPITLLRAIYLRPDDIYSREKHSITLNRLMSMGNFRFVSIRFSENDTSNPGFLNAQIYLTSLPKRTFRTEVDLVTKSNDFTGPRVTVDYKNRNTFNGAELFQVDLSGSYETQLNGQFKNLYSYQISPSVDFIVPRFLVPFRSKLINQTGYYIPKTKFSSGYSYTKRVNYFNLTSLKFSFGYKWKENIKKEHEFLPVTVNYTRLSKPSAIFSALLEANPFLKRSYEEQFIAGLSYSFTYNEQVIPQQKNQFYFNGTAEFSGNTLSTINRITTGEKADSDNPQSFAGSVYSQFSRFTIDMRNYFNFPKKNKIVLRLYTGVGIPYGNSSTLPYIKQFFSGGPNSIRSFLINSVGPGTYHAPEGSQLSFLLQGGDMKIESNAEYRCNLIGIIKGALFIDAGNTWFLKRDTLASSVFRFADFSSQLAAGMGCGIRLDASFFVLRFDLSTPVRKPWLTGGDKWVLDEINFSSREWRRENLVLNIAIGYPF